jgi:hypothetical protein
VNKWCSEKWRDILVLNNLDDHKKIWALQAEWFEEPNRRRGGWSGVSRIELNLPDGNKVGVFLKRQEDHVSRTLRHPIKGLPTFAREFEKIRSFEKNHIPSLELIAFEQWEEEGHQCAILMTKELEGYSPLTSEEYQPSGFFVSTMKQKDRLFKKLASLMRTMHKSKLQHNCFYLKHIFAKPLANGEIDLRVIDLEKAKEVFFKERAEFRDLCTLHRHAEQWGAKDQLRFFHIYREEKKLTSQSKKLLRKIIAKVKRKSKN